MTSKDKENKSIQDKLKQFFRINKANPGAVRSRGDFVLSEDVQRELQRDVPIATRTKAIRELTEIVAVHRLEDKGIEKLWVLLQDLLVNEQTELRHLVLFFFQALVKGQRERLDLLRSHFFKVVKQHNHPEDIIPRFELFQSLTDNGKDILFFEEEVGPFLLAWLPDVTRAGKTQDFLSILVNVFKFNAAYVDKDVITGLVQHVCMLCSSSNQHTIVLSCLQVLDIVVAYSNLPPDSLPQFIGALCRTVNGEAFCQTSWGVMKNLLGTHMGHSALYTMCRILQEPGLQQDSGLLRGSVFFINMGLWSTATPSNLKCPPSSVLPSILCAVKSNQPVVTYEVMLGIQRLVNKHGPELQDPAWDTILNILSIIIKQIETAPHLTPNTLVATHLHETLTTIEHLMEVGSFNGTVKQFFDVIEGCTSARPEASVLRLVSYLAQGILPTRHLWFSNLYNLLQRYYRQEVRTNIRLKVLDVLSNVCIINRIQYEDELIDRIVVPHMISIVNDQDVVIRTAVGELLINLCFDCDSKKCLEMLDILEKLLNRPFELYSPDMPINESEILDIKTVVDGLIKAFIVKINRLPSIHAVKIYTMLVIHLEMHYNKPKIFENCSQIRYKIFDCFLKMRADNVYHLGCMDTNGKVKFSPYLCVTYRTSTERGPMSSPPPASPAVSQQPLCTITYVPLRKAFKIVINCLKQEKDWEVLHLVLQEIPFVLQNKALIMSRHGNSEIDLLVTALCAMITDKSLALPDSLKNAPKLNRSDFHASVLLVLASLASYHGYLEPTHQQRMIRCLVKYGLVPRCSKQCITALTTCTLEMRDVMVKMLPEVLLDLSKISATVNIAIPVLEFLSTLTRLPMVFASFVGDQYMSVFAISLPFTNPFKYNHYIVSLAHHVIAVWFLKCRLPFRKDFVRFITLGLQTNVLIPFEETNKADLSKLNQDSSDRKRSSSLTEQSSRRRERTSTIVGRMDGKSSLEFKPCIDRTLLTFYEELTETCIDFMARYTFSPCSALPKRLPTAEFLLCGGQTMTWLLGNKLITITTSGCSQKALKHGLCDKCWTLCKFDHPKTPEIDGRALKTNRGVILDDPNSTRVTRQNSGEKSNNNTSASSPVEEVKKIPDKLEQLPSKLQQLASVDSSKSEKLNCACWCQGWAEIYVRRPTGDMSWIMRIQNQISHHHTMYDFPLNEISTLFMPTLNQCYDDLESCDSHFRSEDHDEYSFTTSMPISIPGSPHSPSRQSSRDSVDEDLDNIFEDGSKSRNPVRRSNSSPEMSANWKNPFLQQKKIQERDDNLIQDEDISKKKTKDMRVSCEAIPEEIAGMGTTPPSHEFPAKILTENMPHPTLLTCHSYPGPVQPCEPTKTSQTVPQSPKIIQTINLMPRNAVSAEIFKSAKSESLESVCSDRTHDRPCDLPNLSNLPPLASKPPQSPTQTSPRLSRHPIKERESQEVQKSSSLVLEKSKLREKTTGSTEKLNQSEQGMQKRDRGYTISVMSPVHKPRLEMLRHSNLHSSKEAPKSGISPSFVFLQLYHASHFGNMNERPLLIDSNQAIQRSLKVLDRIPPYETHKIGVIYVKDGQCSNEADILRNRFGSMRYVEFLQRLGTLIKLQDVDPVVVFLGGLEQNGTDGKFAYIWQDDVIRVTFHVATLMPNKETDPNCTLKKRHIGNNYVTIVYNESGEDYNINTIKGQFNFACVIVQPLDHCTNKVTVKAKEELVELMGHTEPKIVSDQNVAILARQLALHADLASLVSRSLKGQSQDPYSSNWLERLRKIKHLRSKIAQESKREYPEGQEDTTTTKSRRGHMEDFTEYT